MAQWVTRHTRDRWIPVSREFEPHQSFFPIKYAMSIYRNLADLINLSSEDLFPLKVEKSLLLSSFDFGSFQNV